MKTKISLFIALLLVSGFVLLSLQQLNAQVVPCGNAVFDYKKKWFSTNCKVNPGFTCLLRCTGPQPPDISI